MDRERTGGGGGGTKNPRGSIKGDTFGGGGGGGGGGYKTSLTQFSHRKKESFAYWRYKLRSTNVSLSAVSSQPMWHIEQRMGIHWHIRLLRYLQIVGASLLDCISYRRYGLNVLLVRYHTSITRATASTRPNLSINHFCRRRWMSWGQIFRFRSSTRTISWRRHRMGRFGTHGKIVLNDDQIVCVHHSL